MTYEEAIEKLRLLFHDTRLTKDLHVPAEVAYAILYPINTKLVGFESVIGSGDIICDNWSRCNLSDGERWLKWSLK